MKKKILFLTFLIASLIGNVGLFAMNHTNQQRIENLAWVIDQNYDAYQTETRQKETLAQYLQEKHPSLPAVVAVKWATDIYEATTHYNVPIELARRVTVIESASKQYTDKGIVLSSAGAIGMFQIMPGTWGNGQCPHSKQPADLKDSTVNAWCGAFILSKLIKKYDGNLKEVLTHYYAGNRGVRLRRQGIDITEKYAERVLNTEA